MRRGLKKSIRSSGDGAIISGVHGCIKKRCANWTAKLRRRIRAIIWKQWKSIRKKEESLIKLGCPRDKAHSYACARQGYVRCATTFLNKYIRNIHLKKKGLLSIEEYFDTVAERFMKTFVRTAQCRTACWVV